MGDVNICVFFYADVLWLTDPNDLQLMYNVSRNTDLKIDVLKCKVVMFNGEIIW